MKKYTEEEQLRLLRAEKLQEQGNIEFAEAYYTKALRYFQQALQGYQTLNYNKGIIEVYLSRGMLYLREGKKELTSKDYNDALQMAQEGGFPFLTARSYAHLAILHRSMGDNHTALAFHRKSLDINQRFGNKTSEAIDLNNMGNSYYDIGEYEPALDLFQRAMNIGLVVGDTRLVANTLANMGNIYQILGKYELSIEKYTEATEIAIQIESRQIEGAYLLNLAKTLCCIGKYTQAIQKSTLALNIAIKIQNMPQKGSILGEIGRIYFHTGEYERSLLYLNKALELVRKINNKREEGLFLGYQSKSLYAMGKKEEAKRNLQAAISICESISFPAQHLFQGLLATWKAQSGHTEEALALIQYSDSKLLSQSTQRVCLIVQNVVHRQQAFVFCIENKDHPQQY